MFIWRVSLRVSLPQLPMQCASHRKRVLLNDKFLMMWKNVSQPLNFKALFQHSQEGTASGCICSHMKPHCEQQRQYCRPCSNPTLQWFWDRWPSIPCARMQVGLADRSLAARSTTSLLGNLLRWCHQNKTETTRETERKRGEVIALVQHRDPTRVPWRHGEIPLLL